MKKLLLILLCLPMIGFGQQTYVPVEEEYDEVININGDTEQVSEAEYVKEGELSLFEKIKYIFISGGTLFMSILSFILLLTLASFIFLKNKNIAIYVGLIALLFGILGTIINSMGAFDAIEAAGDISPSLVAGGMKVAMITTVYGLIIFIISVVLKVISLILKKR